MNNLTIKGNWNVLKGKLRQKYAQLTDDDFAFIEGKEDELIGRLQLRAGATRGELERFFQEADAESKAERGQT